MFSARKRIAIIYVDPVLQNRVLYNVKVKLIVALHALHYTDMYNLKVIVYLRHTCTL